MESTGEVGKVNISQSTYDQIKDDPSFTFTSRGKIKAKHKGEIQMYYVERAKWTWFNFQIAYFLVLI